MCLDLIVLEEEFSLVIIYLIIIIILSYVANSRVINNLFCNWSKWYASLAELCYLPKPVKCQKYSFIVAQSNILLFFFSVRLIILMHYSGSWMLVIIIELVLLLSLNGWIMKLGWEKFASFYPRLWCMYVFAILFILELSSSLSRAYYASIASLVVINVLVYVVVTLIIAIFFFWCGARILRILARKSLEKNESELKKE